MDGDDEIQTEARRTIGLRQREQCNKALSLEHQDEQYGKTHGVSVGMGSRNP